MGKKYLDDSWIRAQHALYLAGKSTTDIARAGGCGRSTVYARFRELGLAVRDLAEGRKMGGRPYIADESDPVEEGTVGLRRTQWEYVDSLDKNRSAAMRQIVDYHRANYNYKEAKMDNYSKYTIEVYYSEDSLFHRWDSETMEQVDVSASMDNYARGIKKQLEKEYPGANVKVIEKQTDRSSRVFYDYHDDSDFDADDIESSVDHAIGEHYCEWIESGVEYM